VTSVAAALMCPITAITSGEPVAKLACTVASAGVLWSSYAV
jgi:hypothetical protein